MKDIPRFPGYCATFDGLIIDARDFEPVVLMQMPGSGSAAPYLHVRIKNETLPVHRLVCRAFHGPKPTPQHLVRHLDGNPQNNAAINLAWGTVHENHMDMVRHGTSTQGEKNPSAKLTDGEVRVIRKLARIGVAYEGIASIFAVIPPTISLICRYKRWAHIV